MIKIEQQGYEFLAFTEDDRLILTVDTREITIPKGKYEEEDLCIIESIVSGEDATKDEQLIALKEIFFHLRDEYDHFPGIDNTDDNLDYNACKLIETLIASGHIPKEQLIDSEDSLAQFNAGNQEAMKNLIASTTTPRTKTSFGGYVPYNYKLHVSSPRSFSKERFPQLLRQIATQLYHFCRSMGFNPTEVQIMYFNDSLFISANTQKAVFDLMTLLKSKDDFKKALITPYNYKGADSFDRKTSARHAKKLKARLYGDYESTDTRFLMVQKILNSEPSKISLIIDDKDETCYSKIEGIGNIYFVTHTLKADRHAEENLLDIIDNLFADCYLKGMELKPAIFGKKRPCFTCHARLEANLNQIKENFNNSFEFNPNKGLLFMGAAERQLKNTTSAEASAASLGSYTHDIYTSKGGDSSYATESDSEIENTDEKEAHQMFSSLSLKD